MKNILILGVGGSPATNFVRSLRDAPEKFNIVGTDCDKFNLYRSEADSNHLIPRCDDEKYIEVLNGIIEEEKIDFLHIQNDLEIAVISENREKINTKTFLPDKETVKICQNKYASFKKWEKAKLPQPKTVFLNHSTDLNTAFDTLGKKIWIREQSGAGGRGSLPTDNFQQARAWIDFKQGWGKFIAAEYLSPDSVTWQSIWKDGELIVAQTRKRLYWELGKVSPSGVSGATGGAITVSDFKVDFISEGAIFAIDKKPDGIFSVDLTYDKNGIPVPTEINIGRFFTTHYFFTKAGLNMPYIFVKEAFNEEYEKPKKSINPLPDNLLWVRGMDFLPILIKDYDK